MPLMTGTRANCPRASAVPIGWVSTEPSTTPGISTPKLLTRSLTGALRRHAAVWSGQPTAVANVSPAASAVASRTGCSPACPARRPGIPPPRAAGSAAASRTRTRGIRAAGRPAAPPRPPRNATAGRRPRRNPRGIRRLCRRRLCSLPPPWGVVSGMTLRSQPLHRPRALPGFPPGITQWFPWPGPSAGSVRSRPQSLKPAKPTPAKGEYWRAGRPRAAWSGVACAR